MAVDIDRTLAACEAALSRPGKVDLAALGFWKAVSAVKRDPALVDRYAARIARVDREAFVRAARPFVFPAALGVAVEIIGTVVSAAMVIAAPYLDMPWSLLAFLGGGGGLIGMTHALTHVLVGSAMAIRFTDFFSRPPLQPQPGFKIDYATYLRAPARSRAWMHASGAVVSKVVPFAVAAYAAAHMATLPLLIMLGIGVVQLVTDATLSTKASDWKKFRREMRFAR